MQFLSLIDLEMGLKRGIYRIFNKPGGAAMVLDEEKRKHIGHVELPRLLEEAQEQGIETEKFDIEDWTGYGKGGEWGGTPRCLDNRRFPPWACSLRSLPPRVGPQPTGKQPRALRNRQFGQPVDDVDRRQSLRRETLGPRSENDPSVDRNQCVLPRHVRVAGLRPLPRLSTLRSHDGALRELPRP